jgi:hypothetical protein
LGSLLAGLPLHAAAQTANAARWWPGFIDARGKAFLELPDDGKLCAIARDALRKGAAAPGSAIALPLKIETLLPRGARLAFGVADADGAFSERVLTRVVAVARGDMKGACAYLAEAGADAPGVQVEEDRLAFGVHPPRTITFRAPTDGWKSYGAASVQAPDARFATAADTPPEWRARIAPLLSAPAEIFGQRFDAVLEAGRAAQPLALIGAIAIDAGGATYNTLNLVVREAVDAALFQAGPSGGIEHDRSASFAAQVAGSIDLDGDGVEEVVLRARYYSGGNLRILKFSKGTFTELRQTAYEGE